MSSLLYAKEGKILAKEYVEILIPNSYFEDGFALNKGNMVEAFGIAFIRSNKDSDIKLLNAPTILEFQLYDYETDHVTVHGNKMECFVMKYMKDSYIFHQSIPKEGTTAGAFLNYVLSGKLPKSINYNKLIDIWWKNLEVAGFDYRVPSKILEMILANMYRNPKNFKQRYGQYYGKQTNPTGFDYDTGNVRDIVEGLSTFSGIVYEDINRMITSGLTNTLDGVEEQVSPLEKIIHY